MATQRRGASAAQHRRHLRARWRNVWRVASRVLAPYRAALKRAPALSLRALLSERRHQTWRLRQQHHDA